MFINIHNRLCYNYLIELIKAEFKIPLCDFLQCPFLLCSGGDLESSNFCRS